MNAIELKELSFAYKPKEILLKKINMQIPAGKIYGFLGANGAGKTTTLKLILSLLKNKNQGSIKVLGKNITEHYPSYLKQIGSLIEDASIYSHLTARDNLKIWGNFYDAGLNRIDEVLETIGLSHAKHKKVQHFSTGMKQRLGIGISIMHDPQILILDEPTNGLDPIGIKDLRKLLYNLSAQGKTILLSSHILPEVEKLVDHLGILKEGKIIYEGSLEDLNNTALIDANIIVRVDNIKMAQLHLEKQFHTIIDDGQLVIRITSPDDINKVVRIIIDNEVMLFELIKPKKNLESIFMNLAN